MRKILLILLAAFVIVGCGGCSKKPNAKSTPTPDPPVSALLVTPSNNQVCTTGTSLSNSQSTFAFSWQKSDNTDSYEVHIKNLLTGDSTISTTSQTSASVSLLKSTPYAWYVLSKSSKSVKTARSDLWKFYASGPGVTDTAPYPADLTAPAWNEQVDFAANGMVTLDWDTGSPAGNVKKYDVYWGISPTYLPLTGSSTTNSLSIYVASGTVYYWKVVTTDKAGNTVDSQVSTFYVK